MYLRRLMLVGVVIFSALATSAEAASLYMDPNSVEIKRGDTVSVAVRLDTKNDECVNAIDGVITYPDNIEPVDTSRGSSIFSMWVEDPVINKQNNTITFAGGIPNGYCGRIPGDPRLSNVIIELLFRSPGMVVGAVSDSDVVSINFDESTRAFLNDGFGTQAPLTTYGTQIYLSKTVGNVTDNEWSDRINADNLPPEKFSIQLQQTPNAFSNKHYIVFNTTDKQSGIDHYEVIEEPLEDFKLFNWGAATAPWIEARSPYVLKDQSLNHTIRVRALDKAGNEYIAVLVPDESKRSMSFSSKIMFALVASSLLLFIGAGLFVWFWSKQTKRGRKNLNVSKDETLDEDINE